MGSEYVPDNAVIHATRSVERAGGIYSILSGSFSDRTSNLFRQDELSASHSPAQSLLVATLRDIYTELP